MARAYRKKPVTVEAVQWTGENHAEMCEFIDPEVFEIIPRVGLVIHTLEGDHHASPGDYIIKGVNGEFYPCKPDIFAKTYASAALTPPNEPLTLEQLRKMDGEPVYIIASDMGIAEWNVIAGKVWFIVAYNVPHNGFKTVVEGIRFINGRAFRFDSYGTSWLVYRRPPEGEEDT